MRVWSVSASVVLAALVGLGVAAPASGSDTIGQTYYSSSGGCCDSDQTYFQITRPSSGGGASTAPYDGVITSWSSQGHLTNPTFKVARFGGSAYTVIASDGPRTSPPGELRTFEVRIPVRQGDAIGVHSDGNLMLPSEAGAAVTTTTGDVAVGTSQSYSGPFAILLPISAQLERDRDGDGYGDETQDACPTNASTQGPCPAPTVLGQLITAYAGGQSCVPSTRVVASSPGVVSSAPFDGVITSWSHMTSATLGTGTIKLKMLRPLGGTGYRAIGEATPQSPAAATVNTYPTRIPVRQGDRIGLGVSGGPVPCSQFTAPGTYDRIDSDLAVGSEATLNNQSGALDISAVLEADGDGDGYGDSSQDLCPTDATTQGACRTTTPPPDDTACEKAKKKLAKAKAKLKKLKKADASAKKVKGAKAKVKKAKKAVKKAC